MEPGQQSAAGQAVIHRVTGPDGQVHEFPGNIPDDVIDRAMRVIYQGPENPDVGRQSQMGAAWEEMKRRAGTSWLPAEDALRKVLPKGPMSGAIPIGGSSIPTEDIAGSALGLARTIQGLSTPKNLMLAGGMALTGGVPGLILRGLMGAGMAKGAYEDIKRGVQEPSSALPRERTADFSSGGLNTLAMIAPFLKGPVKGGAEVPEAEIPQGAAAKPYEMGPEMPAAVAEAPGIRPWARGRNVSPLRPPMPQPAPIQPSAPVDPTLVAGPVQNPLMTAAQQTAPVGPEEPWYVKNPPDQAQLERIRAQFTPTSAPPSVPPMPLRPSGPVGALGLAGQAEEAQALPPVPTAPAPSEPISFGPLKLGGTSEEATGTLPPAPAPVPGRTTTILRNPRAKQVYDPGKSIANAIRSLGGLNPDKIKRAGLWTDFVERVPTAIRLQVLRKGAAHGLDTIGSELEHLGYPGLTYSGDSIIEALAPGFKRMSKTNLADPESGALEHAQAIIDDLQRQLAEHETAAKARAAEPEPDWVKGGTPAPVGTIGRDPGEEGFIDLGAIGRKVSWEDLKNGFLVASGGGRDIGSASHFDTMKSAAGVAKDTPYKGFESDAAEHGLVRIANSPYALHIEAYSAPTPGQMNTIFKLAGDRPPNRFWWQLKNPTTGTMQWGKGKSDFVHAVSKFKGEEGFARTKEPDEGGLPLFGIPAKSVEKQPDAGHTDPIQSFYQQASQAVGKHRDQVETDFLHEMLGKMPAAVDRRKLLGLTQKKVQK